MPPTSLETRVAVPATSQNVDYEIDLRQSGLRGRYRLDRLLVNNGSNQTLQVDDSGGLPGIVLPNQPLELPGNGQLHVVITPLSGNVAANEVQIILKWEVF